MNHPTPPLIWLGDKHGIFHYETVEAVQHAPLYLVTAGFFHNLQLLDVTGTAWMATLKQKPEIPFLARLFDSRRIINIDLDFKKIGVEDLEPFKAKLITQYKRYPGGFSKQFIDRQTIISGIQKSISMAALFHFIAETVSQDARLSR